MYRLSKPQTAIYEMDRFGGGSIAGIAGDMFFERAVSAEDIGTAVNCLLRDCETLRTRIIMRGDAPMQEIAPFVEEQLNIMSFDSLEAYAEWARDEAKKPVDIFGKLYMFAVVRVCGKAGLFCNIHHIIGDAWTMGLIAERLCEYLDNGTADEVYPYASYIETEDEYASGKRYAKDRAYWISVYDANSEVSYLSEKQIKSNASERKHFALTKEQSEKIKEYCRLHDVSEYVLFLSAVSAYFYRVTDKEQFYIGTPVINRSTLAEKNTVGTFINTIPLSLGVGDETVFAQLCERTEETVSSAFRHQKLLYSELLKTLRAERGHSDVLFDVVVSYQNMRLDGGATLGWHHCGAQTESLQIHVDDRNGEGVFHIDYDYQTEKYTEDEIERMCGHMLNLLFGGIGAPDKKVCELDILSDEEYQKVIYEFNDTAVDYPKDKTVHQLFEEQVERTPDRAAVIACDKTLTYRELNEQANRIAHGLIENGVKPGDIVALMLPRRSYLIAAMFGILKAGAAYMPIDPSFPQERVNYMLNESRSVFCVDDHNITILISSEKKTNPYCLIKNNFVLCALHTSGSTGLPKMSLLNHGSIMNFIAANKRFWSGIDTVVSATNITFDAFVMDSIITVALGLRVVLASEVQIYNQAELETLFDYSDSNLFFSTPTKIENYIDNSIDKKYLSKVKSFVIGGEVFGNSLLKKIKHNSENSRVFNIYGPTETTICVLIDELTEDKQITIGKPIANTQIYILDRYLKPVPIGVPGELCIAGDCVGAGYLNRPELTAEKFIPNPFGKGKMYKTGDIAKWRADGNIEYIGRNDFQVKIRGLRIELGEIENAISGVEGISQAVAVVRKDNTGRQLICAFYTGKPVEPSDIRAEISKKLPKYMLPHIFTHLEKMPMTSSGKVSRTALPEIDLENISTGAEYIAPVTETQKKLCAIIAETLKAEKVGLNDDFFELGGDSLVAISLTNRLETAFNVRVDMKDLFEHSVMRTLAEYIDGQDKASAAIPALGKDSYPLTPQQAALYAVCQRDKNSLAYNMPMRLKLPDETDRSRLSATVKTLFERHKIFRTKIVFSDGGPEAVFDETAGLVFEDVADEKEFVRAFDLSQAPLLRVGFCGDSLLLDTHHIVCDGETVGLLFDELGRIYGGEKLLTEALWYGDYAEYLRSELKKEAFDEHLRFYGDMLSGEPEPVELPVKKEKGNAGKGVTSLYEISHERFSCCKALAKKYGVTETALFFGVYSILLSKYSASENILSAVIMTNRTHKETAETAGMFVNTLPVLIKAEGKLPFDEYIRYVNEILLSVSRYQELPFAVISERLKLEGDKINNSFVYQAGGKKAVSLGGTEIDPEYMFTDTAKFDLTAELVPEKDGCVLRMEYNADKYEQGLIDRLADSYIRLLGQLDKETSLSELNVLSDEEYQKVIYEFNDTAVDYPKDKTVHQLFEEQVERTPDKTAVIACDRTLTYRDLNEQANRIAHGLIENGVKPGDIVALMLPRRSYLIAAMFGILKAGAAYMPIDISYSDERIQFMLDDSKTDMLVVSNCIDERNIDTEKIVDINELLHGNSSAPNVIIDSESLCYCIYTSGSTGTPKGTLLTHKGLNNFCHNNNNNYQHKMLMVSKTVVATTPISFDISAFELFLPLLNGLQVVIANEYEIEDGQKVGRLIRQYDIDVIQTTPTKIQMYCNSPLFCKELSLIKTLMIGAEVFTEQLYNTIRKHTNAIIYNGYGPTETTIGVSFGEINPDTMVGMFAKRVILTPDNTALIFEGRGFTYSQLDNMSNSLANRLKAKGVNRNDVIPIISKRSYHLIVAMLAVIKAGGAFMPIDPQYPEDRIGYMVSESHSKFALTFRFDGSLVAEKIDLEKLNYAENTSPLSTINTSLDSYCVLHTSGSTGKPKCAVISHMNMVNFTNSNQFLLAGIENVIAINTLTFDVFQMDTMFALVSGVCCILANENEQYIQSNFEALMAKYSHCLFWATPSKIRNYINNSGSGAFFKSIDCYVVGGEIVTNELLESVWALNRQTKIYTVYGPTETLIYSTMQPLERYSAISLGKPIANTQIYILDKYLKPVPIGVNGELCISGDGVGKGYLNRPELTAEKFIPNPFGKGKMYKTGDIAKWRADGNIEYIGRNDFQVKIRGLRIELGEIEIAMSQVESIQQSVVIVRKDSTGRQLICAFYTGKPVEPSDIRAEISKKLPKYMLPHIFTHLEKMPMTSSGKISRTALPEIDLENISSGAEYEPPVTETEKKLCGLMAETLKAEKVGMNDDFFELGGDSLKAIEFVSKAHAEGIYFALQNVFDCPTVKLLCAFMVLEDKPRHTYSPEDFTELHRLLASNKDDGSVPERTEVGNVLIAGATGFLGIHILAEYLESETGTAYCLVRGHDDADARARFEKLLEYYFGGKYLDLLGSRIFVLCGDVQKENLALPVLPPVQTIINAAASVKHYGSYKYFYDANVQSVRNMIDAAKKLNARFLHTSTLSVSGNSFADEFDSYRSDEEKHFGEKDLFIGQPLDNVYARSKFEAEKLVLEEMRGGLNANIFRMGNLTNRASDGMFQKNYESNAFVQRVKGIIELGQCPDYLLRHYVEFTPIDEAAKAVMTAARHFNTRHNTFHINSTKVVYIDRLMALFGSLGVKVEITDGAVFTRTLREAAKQSGTEYLFETFINDMDENEQLNYDSNIRIDNDVTADYLRRIGFEWGDIGEEYLSKWVRWFRDVGYWRA